MRLLWVALGWVFVGLAILGVVLPGLPTTPFLLLAAWAFHRGSRRWANWLEQHRLFGPLLRNWQQHRIIPRHAKVVAISTMLLSLGYLTFWSQVPGLAVAAIAAVMVGSGSWILWCPSARPAVPATAPATGSGDDGGPAGPQPQ